jgi:biopolymer transport protein ExbD
MSSYGRLDVILLALMLAYVFAVVLYVSCRCYLARRARGIDKTSRRTLAATLNIHAGNLKSIALTAPYLGFVGTCEGILSAFAGIVMAKHAALMMITTKVAMALIPTAVAIPVTVVAACSYNFLRIRIDLLGGFDEGQGRDRHFPGVRRFAPTKRFSELPGFGLLAVLTLAFAVMGFMIVPDISTPKGFYVELAPTHCEEDVIDQLVVLHITDTGKLFLNQEQEDWNNLAGRLSEIYSVREHRTLYLLGDFGLSFQTVAHALDIVEGASTALVSQAVGVKTDRLYIKVRLVTPKTLNSGCLVTGSGHRSE